MASQPQSQTQTQPQTQSVSAFTTIASWADADEEEQKQTPQQVQQFYKSSSKEYDGPIMQATGRGNKRQAKKKQNQQ